MWRIDGRLAAGRTVLRDVMDSSHAERTHDGPYPTRNVMMDEAACDGTFCAAVGARLRAPGAHIFFLSPDVILISEPGLIRRLMAALSWSTVSAVTAAFRFAQ